MSGRLRLQTHEHKLFFLPVKHDSFFPVLELILFLLLSSFETYNKIQSEWSNILFPHKIIIVEFINLIYFNITEQNMYDSENKWKVGLLKFSSKI